MVGALHEGRPRGRPGERDCADEPDAGIGSASTGAPSSTADERAAVGRQRRPGCPRRGGNCARVRCRPRSGSGPPCQPAASHAPRGTPVPATDATRTTLGRMTHLDLGAELIEPAGAFDASPPESARPCRLASSSDATATTGPRVAKTSESADPVIAHSATAPATGARMRAAGSRGERVRAGGEQGEPEVDGGRFGEFEREHGESEQPQVPSACRAAATVRNRSPSALARTVPNAPRRAPDQPTRKECSASSTRLPRGTRYRPPGLAPQRTVVGTAHDRAVRREPVGDPQRPLVGAELEVRLRDRERAVGDLHEVVVLLAGLRHRTTADEAAAEHRARLAGAELQHELGLMHRGRGRGPRLDGPGIGIRARSPPARHRARSPSPPGTRRPGCSPRRCCAVTAARAVEDRRVAGPRVGSPARLGRRARGAAAFAAEHRALGEFRTADATFHVRAPLRVTAYPPRDDSEIAARSRSRGAARLAQALRAVRRPCSRRDDRRRRRVRSGANTARSTTDASTSGPSPPTVAACSARVAVGEIG